MNILSIFRFINFSRSVSIYILLIYPDTIRCTVRNPLFFVPDTLNYFYLLLSCYTFALKKNQPIISNCELCASSKQYYVPTLCLDMSDLLPVTPTIQTAKPEITISQQLLSRFRSSFQGMKPYPYANKIIIYNCININIYCDKVNSIFCKLPLLIQQISLCLH